MKNKIIFILGRTASVLGTQIYNFVFALMILYTTGSAINFAISIVLETVPRILFSAIAGVVADRLNRKKILIYSDLLSGIILILAFFLWTSFISSIWLIFIVTFILNSINTFFDVTMTSSLDMLFKEDGMESMCSIYEGISSLIALLAPTLGAAVYAAFGFEAFIIMNGVSFLVSAFTEMYLDYPDGEKLDVSQDKSIKYGFVETISFLKEKRVVFDLYFVAIFINIFFGIAATLSLPIILTKYMNLSEVEYGLIETVLSIGMLAGATVFSFIKAAKRYKLIITSLMFEAISIMLLSLPYILSIRINKFIIYSIIVFILGFSVSSVNINVRVLMQKLIPENMKGKVLGTLSSMCLSISPIVIVCGSFYIDKNNPCWLVFACGIAFVFMNIILSMDREMKKV